MTDKYLRAVQYARRHGRVGDVPSFAAAFARAGWFIPPVVRYFQAVAALEISGPPALLSAAGDVTPAHPLDWYLRGLACLSASDPAGAESAFQSAEGSMAGDFPEAALARALAAAATDCARGRTLVRRALNLKPDYLDAWLAWQAPPEALPTLPPTRYPCAATLHALLLWEHDAAPPPS